MEIYTPEYEDLPYTCFPHLLDLDKLSSPDFSTELMNDRYRPFRRKGHPYSLSYMSMWLLDNYHTTGDVKYLRAIDQYTDMLLEAATIAGDALFLPYQFDFWLHSRPAETEHMRAPWYSGMAQGIGLTLFSRLYKTTGESKYLNISKQLLNSLYIQKGDGPWVTLWDKDGFFWIEEYPLAGGQSDRTLNGFIFGIYGLCNYSWNIGGVGACLLLEDALRTIKHYLPEYRHPGGISSYCLKHKEIRNAKYHMVHIDQLKRLYKYTGDDFFEKYAGLFEADYCDPKIRVPN